MVAARRTLPAPPELQSRWAAVLEEAGLRPAILAVSDNFPETRSLEVPFATLDAVDTPLADLLLERPDEVLDAGRRAMRELLPVAGPEAEALRLRPTGLPPTAHRAIRELRETDLNRFIAIDGIVRRVTEVRPQIRDAVFQCVACRTEFHEPQDDASMVFREPLECPDSQGGCGRPAGRTRFRLLPEKSTYVDAQRIEMQENPESLRRGAHPQGIAVLLTEDLTGHVLPGNRVVLNGVLKSYQRGSPGRGGAVVRNTTFDLLVLGVSVESKVIEYDEIEITPEEEALILSFRGDPTIVDKIVLSLAPTIRGMEQEKEAIALQMFGGVEKRHSDGIRVRGDIHALIVGDPGTAKSQLLRYVSEVAPRAIYTSGKGATAAGLTAAAVKDDFAGGRWVLEAGMLVLADGGMAVIDELDKMSPEDRSAMHEALEQQSMHPEFELMFLNGEKRPIGEFVDDLIQRHPERVIPGKDCEILPLEGEKFSLLTTDFHGLRGVVVDRVSRHQAPPRFLRVTYGNGRALRVTPEHPVFVWRAGGWQTVPAEQVCVGDLAPGVSEYPRALNEAVLRAPDLLPGGNGITFPTEVGPELSRLIGYLLSRGHVPGSIDATPSEIRVRATDLDLAADLSALFSSTFGVETLLQLRKPSQSEQAPLPLYDVRAVSPELLRYFQENFPELARKASEKRVPGALFHATEECRTQFLLGAYRGDGFYDSERFGFATGSEGLARDYSDLLLSLGVYTDIESSSDRQGRDRTGILVQVVVSGAQSQRRFLDLVAGRTTTASRIRKIVEQSESHPMDSDRFPKDLVDRVELLLKELGLGKRPTHRPQGNRLRRSSLATGLRAAENRLAALPTPVPAGRSWMDLRELYHLSRRAIADRVGRSPTWVSAQSLDRGSPPGRELLRATQELAQEKISWATEEIRELTDRVNSPLRFVPVRKVESIPNSGEKWVYDVTVEPTHTFVSEGLVLHNTVSIAKAGITSTLNARCPVLAAANPKWGRFSPDRTIAEQIDLPPTLLSRFDVIFSIQDHPNQEKDRRLAHGILASHREGEVSGLPGGKAVIESAPFPTDLLKKYIAYARRTVRPVLTSGALVELEDFYVRVRRQGEEPNSPVPITARQLEALVRLSEAAARARLSPDADVEDARRAIQIMENFLKRVSTAEDGKLDIDLAQSGVSHSQRERLDIVMRVMRELQEEGGGTFTMEMFRTATERAGIAGPKAEALLLSLRNQGEVIEPRANQYQLVRF